MLLKTKLQNDINKTNKTPPIKSLETLFINYIIYIVNGDRKKQNIFKTQTVMAFFELDI